MLSDISDEVSSVHSCTDDEDIRPRKKKRLKTRKQDHTKKNITATSEQPSVYSSSEIRRHEKRLNRLKALEQGYGSDTETESEGENVDPDLDINLRIFESSAASTDNLIIGEIQCNVKADDKVTPNDTNERGSKNSSVFKVSVNANFDENSVDHAVRNTTADEGNTDDDMDKEVDKILGSDSWDEFTEDDSDLEILMSKPIIRKRSVPPTKKEKPAEVPIDKKLTMYDLIHDSPRRSSDSIEEDEPDDTEGKSKKRKKIRKNKIDKKTEEPKRAPSEEIVGILKTNESKPSLGVPQVKITADGKVIVDTDSLVIEHTGLSEARNAIASSELIEEYGWTHTSYRKKRNLPKQWSPSDTLKFYHVLSTIGTDFSLMATLFPGRTRTCMKRKFKREEKTNGDLILKALSCKQNFDLGLLEKELRIKEERVNKLRENSKKQKVTDSPKNKDGEDRKKSKRKSSTKQRRSYFETSIQCFQR